MEINILKAAIRLALLELADYPLKTGNGHALYFRARELCAKHPTFDAGSWEQLFEQTLAEMTASGDLSSLRRYMGCDPTSQPIFGLRTFRRREQFTSRQFAALLRR